MFEDVPAGPLLAAALAEGGLGSLDLCDAVDAVAAVERLASWVSALQADAINQVLQGDPGETPGFDPVVEIAAALGLSIHATSFKVNFAAGLDRLPLTMGALRAADIDLARARRFVEGTEHCSPEVAQRVEAELMPLAPRLSPTQLARRIARLIAALDPTETEKRRREERTRRRVEFRPLSDSMGWLGLTGPVEELAACMSAISARALADRRAGKKGTLDALRFDAAVELLTSSPDGRAPAGEPLVHVTVPLATLLGAGDSPGEISGTGCGSVVVPASVARRISAEGSEWIRIVTDPATGQICSHERRVYRPKQSMRDNVKIRDQHCRAVGCDAPVWRCDADHNENWPDGPTCECNLTMFCRRHHNAKTHGGWRATSSGHDGVLTMTSPLGRVYTTSPDPPVGDRAPTEGRDDPIVDLIKYHDIVQRLRVIELQLTG